MSETFHQDFCYPIHFVWNNQTIFGRCKHSEVLEVPVLALRIAPLVFSNVSLKAGVSLPRP